MDKENKLPSRKPTRLKDFDYNAERTYFITICTESRRKILSRIVGDGVLDVPNASGVPGAPSVELLPYGKTVDKYINRLNDFYEHITVDKYVIMPDHIHLILYISDSGASRTPPPTKQNSPVSQFVSTLKRFCNKEFGGNVWQRGFYNHIIRNHEDYEKHVHYITMNPIRRFFDNSDTSEF